VLARPAPALRSSRGALRSAPMPTLFGVPASHPTLAAELMLEHKGIDYRRIDFAPAAHRLLLRLVGFRGRTVPALRIDGRKLQGSRLIARELDAMQPDPPLFPADPERRAAAEDAERWGDEELQPLARRMSWANLKRDRSTMRSYLEGARLGLPTGLAARTATPLVFLSARLNKATDEAAQADLAALPRLLNQVDAWVGSGLLGSRERNAADFQIATSLRLLGTFGDIAPLLAGRPAEEFARRVVPSFPGHLDAGVLPAQWLPA
jgi:glutathione S-transferase